MDLKVGTKSTCVHCEQPLSWTSIKEPTPLERESVPEAAKAPAFSSWYAPNWRHSGASWAHDGIRCDEMFQPEGGRRLQAKPKTYCIEQVEYYGEYSLCNRRAKGEPPDQTLCGMHLKPVREQLLRNEENAKWHAQQAAERAIKELLKEQWQAVVSKIPIKAELSSTYRSDPLEWTVDLQVSDILGWLGWKVPLTSRQDRGLELTLGQAMEAFGLSAPGEDEEEVIPDWAVDAEDSSDVEWEDEV